MQEELKELRNFSKILSNKDDNDNKQDLREVIVNENYEVISRNQDKYNHKWLNYKNLTRLQKTNNLENFYQNLIIKSEGVCSEFLKQLI